MTPSQTQNPRPADPLAFRVFNEIGIIEQLSRNRFERVMPPGMTLPQFSVLNHFVRLGGESSPARLAAAFQVTRQTMTSTLHRLERAGLVSVRPDPADGRAKIVAVTDKGAAVRETCVAAVTPVLEHMTELAGTEDLAALLPALSRLRAALDADRDVKPVTRTSRSA